MDFSLGGLNFSGNPDPPPYCSDDRGTIPRVEIVLFSDAVIYADYIASMLDE
jgi:hypothetical protein